MDAAIEADENDKERKPKKKRGELSVNDQITLLKNAQVCAVYFRDWKGFCKQDR